ncbi:SufS family cysteine desulfurase [Vibrio sp. JC009]|uniref:SufS family cysteine desulfurase n=1 Tax=Vibrio sp. JC009 TaxID=2912314 RepID=UPI0023AEC5F6|nr:SufS family cysteine desulfurase [Vibrio sp. JC009]WED23972.1 SufS family cysteine desulfurase [Vibrio sp. JC009]
MTLGLPVESLWRSDFPVLAEKVHDKPLVYLDSAATAQTPQFVTDRMVRFYQKEYATVHRGVHYLSSKATDDMEQVRSLAASFLGAPDRNNILFTKGTTEAINLVASSFLKPRVKPGDEIIVTEMEHHANLVPWQLLAQEMSLKIKVWPVTQTGELDAEDLRALLGPKTSLLAVTHISNVLGTVNPIESFIELAYQHKVPVLIDGAQAVMHQSVDVSRLDCDFYAFSAHKLYGPTGIGVLYAKSEHLEGMIPWEGGGAMIDKVELPYGTTFGDAPWRFEAGTPNIAGILGMGAAIEYVRRAGLSEIHKHEQDVLNYALSRLGEIAGLEVYGSPEERAGVLSFNLGKHHAYDVGSFLDRYGIAIRTGHHCAMPLISRMRQTAVCRASVGMYTDSADIDALVNGLSRVSRLLG